MPLARDHEQEGGTGQARTRSPLGPRSGQVALVTGGSAGLGLAIVQSVIADHHWTIGVESHPGSGTTFIIDLPAADVRSEGRT